MSETWLNSTVPNGEIAIDDYKIFRQDRLHKKGGGVCAFVKKVLKVTIINELTNTSESNFQQLWIKLQNKKMKTIIICVIYIDLWTAPSTAFRMILDKTMFGHYL